MNILNHDSIASEWLSGLDLDGRTVNVIIAGVEEVTVPEPRTGRQVRKVAVRFQGARKALLLNATNAKALAKLFGAETNGWTGKGVALRAENVQAFGQTHCVVRVAGAAAVKLHQPKQADPEPALDTPRDTADDLWADERAA